MDFKTYFENQSRFRVVGIDPGFTGAIAVFNMRTGLLDYCRDMPVTERTRKYRSTAKAPGRVIDINQLLTFIGIFSHEVAIAVLESQNPRETDGVSSAFKLGTQFGILQTALMAHGIPTLPAIPSVWKSSMGLGPNKEDSIKKARKIFPTIKERIFFLRQKDHGRAEAALLAFVGAEALRNSIARTKRAELGRHYEKRV